MANAFSRSWEITKLSFNVIKNDKELLLFPILASIFSLLYLAVILVPTIVAGFIGGNLNSYSVTEYSILFIAYLGLAFIATFFNVCVVYTTKIRFEGGNATFTESFKFAVSKIHLIFSWSLVAATVGILLRIIDRAAERMGGAGKIMLRITTSIIGMAWSIITIFVVPAMVYNNLGPIGAIKKSTETIKKTWGESIIRHFGLGLIQFAFLFIGIMIAVFLFVIMSGLGAVGLIITASISVIYFIGVILVFSIANSIFNTALYVYADKGNIPSGYNQDILSNAFKSTSKKQI